MTSYWQADCSTDFLGDTSPPPPPPHPHWLCLLLFSYSFLTYKRHFSKFSYFGFSTITKNTRENSTVLRCQKKKLQKLPSFHFNRSQTSLEYVRNEDFPSLKMSMYFQTSSHTLKRTRNVAKKFELTASVTPFFCKVTYRWRDSHATRSKSPSAGMGTGKINLYKTRFAGVSRERSRECIVQRGGGKNAGFSGLSPSLKV